MIREARPEDLDSLCGMARRFVAETSLPLTYDAELTRQTLWSAIHSPENILLVSDSNGVLCSAVMGFIDRDFCVESCAYITKLYIEKEFRGLGASRSLLSAFDTEAKRRGAKVLFASATAGMGGRIESLYVKLFERAGYSVLGRVLVKEIADG